MKKRVVLISSLIALVILLLIPFVKERVDAEKENKNITVSLLYNDIMSKVSDEKLEESLKEYKEIGVTTVSLMEEDLNAYVSRGDVTSIKYNVLRHKYDDESMEIAALIKEKYPNVNYDSHVVIVSRQEAREHLAYALPRRYTEAEYADIGEYDDLYIYLFHDGRRELHEYAFGYNEKVIEKLSNEGFDIALIHRVKNYSNLEYLDDIDRLVKKYDIEFLNLKEDARAVLADEANRENYIRLTNIINENDMTLVITENADQLSNEKFFGYNYVFDNVMADSGSKKLLRSYETYDDSHIDGTYYKHRVEQFFNSTIDRNIRFVTVTQINTQKLFYHKSADFTLKAVTEYIEKIKGSGFTVNEEIEKIDYSKSLSKIVFALSAVLMVLSALLILKMLFNIKSPIIDLAFLIIAFLAFFGTFVLPSSLISLYPTVFCLVQSCTAITLVFHFIKKNVEKRSLPALIVLSVAIALASLVLYSIAMGAMLSGVDYYFNNIIFRGIKISLLIPIVFSALAFYIMFIKVEGRSVISDVKTVLNLNVKVYAIIIALALGAVGAYYIIRSGNVNTISTLERAMRNAITDIFPARPRTKEFLIGYPAFILFIYYSKKSSSNIIKWILAVASSILFASVTNSFCHVFTDYTTILMRVVNALIIGAVVSALAYLANLVLLFVIKKISNIQSDSEKTNG